MSRQTVEDDARRLLAWVDDQIEAPRHDEVERWLAEHDWDPCGEGDWARAYRCPCRRLAVRVSPFDPVFRFTVRLYREGASSAHLPRLDAHRELDGGGCLMVMEFLTPVGIDEARHWYERLHEAAAHGNAELAMTGELIDRVHREAMAQLPWCGPLDDNPKRHAQCSRSDHLHGPVLRPRVGAVRQGHAGSTGGDGAHPS